MSDYESNKPGRKKFSTDLGPLIESKRPISFNPNKITREELAYCMQETGVYNKSAVIAVAIRHYYDEIVADAIARSKLN